MEGSSPWSIGQKGEVGSAEDGQSTEQKVEKEKTCMEGEALSESCVFGPPRDEGEKLKAYLAKVVKQSPTNACSRCPLGFGLAINPFQASAMKSPVAFGVLKLPRPLNAFFPSYHPKTWLSRELGHCFDCMKQTSWFGFLRSAKNSIGLAMHNSCRLRRMGAYLKQLGGSLGTNGGNALEKADQRDKCKTCRSKSACADSWNHWAESIFTGRVGPDAYAACAYVSRIALSMSRLRQTISSPCRYFRGKFFPFSDRSLDEGASPGFSESYLQTRTASLSLERFCDRMLADLREYRKSSETKRETSSSSFFGRKKSPKGTMRATRMYCFVGHWHENW